MQLDNWKDAVDKIKTNFVVEEHTKKHLDEQGGVDIETIIFESPLGIVKLEFTSKPVVLDRKTTYSNRIGSETQIEYIYSPTEKSCKMLAYKYNENDNEWTPLDNQSFINNF